MPTPTAPHAHITSTTRHPCPGAREQGGRRLCGLRLTCLKLLFLCIEVRVRCGKVRFQVKRIRSLFLFAPLHGKFVRYFPPTRSVGAERCRLALCGTIAHRDAGFAACVSRPRLAYHPASPSTGPGDGDRGASAATAAHGCGGTHRHCDGCGGLWLQGGHPRGGRGAVLGTARASRAARLRARALCPGAPVLPPSPPHTAPACEPRRRRRSTQPLLSAMCTLATSRCPPSAGLRAARSVPRSARARWT